MAQSVDRLVIWLDSAFAIPGTRLRVGLDPILGFVLPVAGDALGGVLALSLVFLGLQYRVPAWVVARMVFNLAIDAAIGGIPFLGDAFDVVWKANERNLFLLREHQARAQPARMPFYYWVVGVVLLCVAVACALLPLVLGLWLVAHVLGATK